MAVFEYNFLRLPTNLRNLFASSTGSDMTTIFKTPCGSNSYLSTSGRWCSKRIRTPGVCSKEMCRRMGRSSYDSILLENEAKSVKWSAMFSRKRQKTGECKNMVGGSN
eukprot:831561-Rhodomonas_salina.1